MVEKPDISKTCFFVHLRKTAKLNLEKGDTTPKAWSSGSAGESTPRFKKDLEMEAKNQVKKGSLPNYDILDIHLI